MEWLYTKLTLLITLENILLAVGIILSIVLLSRYKNKLAVFVDLLSFIAFWGFIQFIIHGKFETTNFIIGLLVFSVLDFIYFKRKVSKQKRESNARSKKEQ